jgi:hypothetical protein
MKPSLRSLTTLLAFCTAGCGGSPTTPTNLTPTPTATPTAVAPAMTALRITGNSALTVVGEKSQLTATATYADGTTKDVTAEAVWSSDRPAVFAVSLGEVTTVAFGIGTIIARLAPRSAFLQLAATPPNTSVFWGRVREPGHSGIPGVRVLETNSGQSQLTDGGGSFQFPGLTTARFRFEKEGFESAEVAGAPGPASFTDAALQRIVRITAGESVSDDLAPHDLSYRVGGDTCFPCKLIRVIAPTGGTVHLNATWTGTTGLNLWVNGVRFAPANSGVTADAPVNAGEILVHAGASSSAYVKFTMTTSVTTP